MLHSFQNDPEDEAQQEKIMTLMTEMQDYGDCPPEIVGDLMSGPAGAEDPMAAMFGGGAGAGGGMPGMPPGMPALTPEEDEAMKKMANDCPTQ
jgi:hypothetical protein